MERSLPVITRAWDALRDAEFVFGVFADVRAREFAVMGLPAGTLHELLRMQHRCQLAAYAQRYPDAERAMVLWESEPIGSWLVDRANAAITLVDIAVLASHRGRGVGAALLASLQREAEARAVPIYLRVRRDNPAQRLYRRAGFMSFASSETELEMEWWPDAGSAAWASRGQEAAQNTRRRANG